MTLGGFSKWHDSLCKLVMDDPLQFVRIGGDDYQYLRTAAGLPKSSVPLDIQCQPIVKTAIELLKLANQVDVSKVGVPLGKMKEMRAEEQENQLASKSFLQRLFGWLSLPVDEDSFNRN